MLAKTKQPINPAINNQMLIADTNTGKIKRFMVGPKECEVTGLTFAPDYKTVFVGIQHPGERLGSNFPDNGNNKPRSCIIAIQKKKTDLKF